MDDLISRQSAIEAIESVDYYHQNRNGEMVHGANPDEHQAWYKVEDVYEALDGVPSVQQWIPCSERLPEKPFGCLVTVWDSTPTGEGDDFENVLPYFVGWDGEQWNDGDGEQCPFEVIAWMPLPDPYREGEEK